VGWTSGSSSGKNHNQRTRTEKELRIKELSVPALSRNWWFSRDNQPEGWRFFGQFFLTFNFFFENRGYIPKSIYMKILRTNRKVDLYPIYNRRVYHNKLSWHLEKLQVKWIYTKVIYQWVYFPHSKNRPNTEFTKIRPMCMPTCGLFTQLRALQVRVKCRPNLIKLRVEGFSAHWIFIY